MWKQVLLTIESLSGQMSDTDAIIQEAATIIQSMAKQSAEIEQGHFFDYCYFRTDEFTGIKRSN